MKGFTSSNFYSVATGLISTALLSLLLSVASEVQAKSAWLGSAKKAIVTIKSKRERFNGVIVSPDGVVFSVSHGFDNKKTRSLEAVLYNGKVVRLDVVANDPYADVVIFKIRGAKKSYPYIKVGGPVAMTEKVTVLGKLSHRQSYSVIEGAVVFNALNLPDFVGGTKKYLPENFSIEKGIFHTAATRPGHSGSALLSESGELVGINSMVLSSNGERSKGAFSIGVGRYLAQLKGGKQGNTKALLGLENKVDFLLEGLQNYGHFVLRDKRAAETLALQIKSESLGLATHKHYTDAKTLQWVWRNYIQEVDALKAVGTNEAV